MRVSIPHKAFRQSEPDRFDNIPLELQYDIYTMVLDKACFGMYALP